MEGEGLHRANLKRLFERGRGVFALRMAPMIDVIFLLLIFFLIAAKWRPDEKFLPFQLPAAGGAQLTIGKAEPLVIRISDTADGCAVQIAEFAAVEIREPTVEADLAGMMEKLRECMDTQKRYVSDPVEMVVAADVKWDYLAKIYNLFYGAGLTDITFAMTEQAEDAGVE
jgi:biopolymer transport protein ExbD